MRGELPVFTRCCLCFPLRYGLLFWGYVRLVLGIFLLITVTTAFIETLNDGRQLDIILFVIITLVILLALTDVVLNILFIIGGHKKTLRLLRAYYIYNCSLFVLMILMNIFFIAHYVDLAIRHKFDLDYVWLIVIDMIIYLGQLLIQFYTILLLRSEMIKLTNKSKFRFVNHAAELEIGDEAKESLYGNANANLEDKCTIKHENDSEQ